MLRTFALGIVLAFADIGTARADTTRIPSPAFFAGIGTPTYEFQVRSGGTLLVHNWRMVREGDVFFATYMRTTRRRPFDYDMAIQKFVAGLRGRIEDQKPFHAGPHVGREVLVNLPAHPRHVYRIRWLADDTRELILMYQGLRTQSESTDVRGFLNASGFPD